MLLLDGKRMKITAVHYDGDSTRLEETRHQSFKGWMNFISVLPWILFSITIIIIILWIVIGNGKVELNKNEYLHWKPAEWVVSHGMDKYFNMDSTGTLTINDHGLFLIYAQVILLYNWYNTPDTNCIKTLFLYTAFPHNRSIIVTHMT